MTDEQRIAKIDELLEQISPLNYERIFLETSLHFSKENFFKNYDEKEKAEIISKSAKALLNIINDILDISKIYEDLPVVLGGGVFQNRTLVEILLKKFKNYETP